MSNHIFTVWQHIVLLVLRQYENKSYRIFSEWLVEAYYLRMSLQLSHIPHYTTLQKFAARINGTILAKIISSFILSMIYINRLFIGIYSSGFKVSCIIPARYEHVPIFRTHGKYRKQMKRGYSKILYHQRKG